MTATSPLGSDTPPALGGSTAPESPASSGSTTRTRRSRATHFSEEAEKRANRIIGEFEKLSRLSNTSSNEYSQQQIDALFAALGQAFTKAAQKFDQSNTPAFTMPPLGADPAGNTKE